MATTTPPLEKTIEPRLQMLPARRTLRRALWLAVDLCATAAFLVHAFS